MTKRKDQRTSKKKQKAEKKPRRKQEKFFCAYCGAEVTREDRYAMILVVRHYAVCEDCLRMTFDKDAMIWLSNLGGRDAKDKGGENREMGDR